MPATSVVDSPNQALLEVTDLTTVFPTPAARVHAVNSVSFSIQPGEVVGIVGESGSGKSVTARSIMRMLRSPGKIESGSVKLRGRDLLAISEPEMRKVRGKEIAMIFQDPQAALNPVMKVGEQIAEALRVHGATAAEARARALELFAQVGIPDVERTIDQYPHEFSGGMRQRVVIAIALANRPALLIADEPTTALDVTIQAQILKLLVDLRNELGVSIMMITHDMGVVAELCDRIVVMYGGRVVETGSVADVFQSPKHPYTAALLNAVPRASDAGSKPLLAIPGSPPDPANLPKGCSFAPRCAFATDQCRTERPVLEPSDSDHQAACWVSQREDSLPPISLGERVRPAVAEVEEPIVAIRDLRTDVGSRSHGFFRKSNPVFAVDGVSLDVFAGQTLGLVGESGCGKSTLSRTVVGINKPYSGSVQVDGHDVTSMGRRELETVANAVQYVFQDPYASLNPRRTIRQSLEEALSVAGTPSSQMKPRALELMDRVGLNPGHLDRYPYSFSGGQRQRVGIARALAANPKVLICDEPVSALDVSIQAQIINLLEELRDDLGLGYLFIAHDLSVVRHLSDQVAVMYLGRIVELGSAATVYSTPQHPYTAALLSSTPEPTLEERVRERIVLTGDLPSPANPPTGCRFRTRCPIGPMFFPEREECMTKDPQLTLTPRGSKAACHFPGELEAAVA